MRRLPPAQLAMPALWLAVFLAIYLPLVGRGFLLDDFAWIAHSRVSSWGQIGRFFTGSDDFYRPLVSLTFATDWWLFQLAPFGYGATNLLLLVGCALTVRSLAKAVGLASLSASGAAALWAFNFSGTNMALLWISGRTSLLVTLFSAAAAAAALRRHRWLSSACVLAALLSKEEALPLPLMIAACLWIISPAELEDSGRRRKWGFALAVPVLVYVLLRGTSGAFLPSTAPVFYRYTRQPGVLARNAIEYAHRTALFGLLCIGLAWIVARARPSPSRLHYRILLLGIVWTVLAFIPTIALPVRSSLYICLPSAGIAVAAAAMIEAVVCAAGPSRRALLLGASLAVPLLLWPIYQVRAQRWVAPAELSSDVVRVMRDLRCPPVSPDYLLLIDDPGDRANLANAFGALMPEAIVLATGRSLPWRIEPPIAAADPDPRAVGKPIATIRMWRGRLLSVREDCTLR